MCIKVSDLFNSQILGQGPQLNNLISPLILSLGQIEVYD